MSMARKGEAPVKKFRNNKRGSTLVTAMLLLVFILAVGAARVQWGMYNVGVSTNVRADEQAYYTAKSVLDTIVDTLQADKDKCKAVDDALLGGMASGQTAAFPVTLSGLPGDAGETTATVTCTGAAEAVNATTIQQTYKIEVSSAFEGQTNRVARNITVTRVTGESTFTGLLAMPLNNNDSITLDGVIIGDTTLYTKGSVIFGNNLEMKGNVTITASTIANRSNGTQIGRDGGTAYTVKITAGAVSVAAQNANQGIRFGNTTYCVGSLADANATYANGQPTKLPWPSVLPEPEQTVEQKKCPVGEDGNDTRELSDVPAALPIEDYEYYKIGGNFNNSIAVDVSGGKTICVLMTMSSCKGFAVSGDGTLNVYYPNGFSANGNELITRVNGSNAVVNFVALSGNIEINGGNKEVQANFICPSGTLRVQGNNVVQGSVWCAGVQTNGQAKVDVTPYPWNDVSSVVEGTGGGGTAGQATVSCTAESYSQ